ncbi:nuclease-related domain-containing protein [Desulfoluna spongiiphila]|uniref:nuclease-related domain-containing protein n=1 Tax=Desulfoluna spongiiphila TaxID=419481 RepID=UPI0012590BBE|nr:nuclease-related domain-containing protein [Desulfoluna spongiiphila]VVS95689.1 nuclease-related domain nerd [Desulfoluna spongiiphila]
MAYIQGSPVDGLKQTVTRHLFLMGTVTVVLAGMMIAFSDDPMAELGPIVAITVVCAAIIGFVSFRSNPLALTMLFKKDRFKEAVVEEEAAIAHLETLSDRCYVFNNLTVELFRIDHLVISPWGIFVMGRVRKEGELRVEENLLHAGPALLDSLCTSTWRVCHLLNIVIRKGWSQEVMPVPVIVPHSQYPSRTKAVDGIMLVEAKHLAPFIESGRKETLSEELVDSIAAYILKRYTA